MMAGGYQRGDRVVLEHTSDPYTRLKPGTRGTVTRYDSKHGQLHVAWDDGSTLAMLLAEGDRIRPAARPPQRGNSTRSETMRHSTADLEGEGGTR
jgi:Domain of unknown function (DUF4314)